MIEQTFRGKDVARVHRQQVEKTLEPACRQRAVLGSHPLGDEVSEIRDDHDGVAH